MTRRRMTTWRSKLTLLLLVFSLVPVLVVAYRDMIVLESTFEAKSLASLQAIARAKAETLEQFTVDRRSEVERIAGMLAARVAAVTAAPAPAEEELPPLQDAEVLEAQAPADPAAPDEEPAEPLPPAPSPALVELRESLGLVLWDQTKFEEILVVDPEGRVVASTHAAHEAKSAAGLGYFQGGLGATYVEPVFHSPITDRLTMVVSTPVRTADGQVAGVLAARLNLERFFRTVNDYTGLGATGETLVGKVIGDDVVFMAPTRHDPAAAIRRRARLGSEEALALQDAARGTEGLGERLDYRGNDVLAAWEHVPSLDWGVVVKRDSAEILAPVRAAQLRTAILLLVIAIAVVLAAWLAARALVEPLRQLRHAAERISRGNFDVQLDIRSDDEIGELAESFERMVTAIRFFRAHSRPAAEDPEPDELESGAGV